MENTAVPDADLLYSPDIKRFWARFSKGKISGQIQFYLCHDAVPRFSHEGKLQSIDGNVPNLVNPPSGCRFHPRCKDAKTICKEAFPETKELGDNHQVACYLYTEKPRCTP